MHFNHWVAPSIRLFRPVGAFRKIRVYKMKNALVTGGSRGIGKAICLELSQMGYHILINYKSNKAAAEELLVVAQLVASPFQNSVHKLLMDFAQHVLHM